MELLLTEISLAMASAPITNVASNKYHSFPENLCSTQQYSKLQ